MPRRISKKSAQIAKCGVETGQRGWGSNDAGQEWENCEKRNQPIDERRKQDASLKESVSDNMERAGRHTVRGERHMQATHPASSFFAFPHKRNRPVEA